jgi:hypothetical protein
MAMSPKRATVVGKGTTGSELRARNRVLREQLPLIQQRQHLLGNTDNHIHAERGLVSCWDRID